MFFEFNVFNLIGITKTTHAVGHIACPLCQQFIWSIRWSNNSQVDAIKANA